MAFLMINILTANTTAFITTIVKVGAFNASIKSKVNKTKTIEVGSSVMILLFFLKVKSRSVNVTIKIAAETRNSIELKAIFA